MSRRSRGATDFEADDADGEPASRSCSASPRCPPTAGGPSALPRLRRSPRASRAARRPLDVLGQGAQRRRRRRAHRRPTTASIGPRRRQLRGQRRLRLNPSPRPGLRTPKLLLLPRAGRHPPRHRPARLLARAGTDGGRDAGRRITDAALRARQRATATASSAGCSAARRCGCRSTSPSATPRARPGPRGQPAVGEPDRPGAATRRSPATAASARRSSRDHPGRPRLRPGDRARGGAAPRRGPAERARRRHDRVDASSWTPRSAPRSARSTSGSTSSGSGWSRHQRAAGGAQPAASSTPGSASSPRSASPSTSRPSWSAGGGTIFHDPAQGTYFGVLALRLGGGMTLQGDRPGGHQQPGRHARASRSSSIATRRGLGLARSVRCTLDGLGVLLASTARSTRTPMRAALPTGQLKQLLFPADPVHHTAEILRAAADLLPGPAGQLPVRHARQADVRLAPPIVRFELAFIYQWGDRCQPADRARPGQLDPARPTGRASSSSTWTPSGIFDLERRHRRARRRARRLQAVRPLPAHRRGGDAPGCDGVAGFALAVGGFHPRFAAPAGLPQRCRGSPSRSPTATTRSWSARPTSRSPSNTVQFGAERSLYAAACGFSIEGNVGFDVLIQLLPLHFLAEFRASVQLKRGSTNLFKVSVDGCSSRARCRCGSPARRRSRSCGGTSRSASTRTLVGGGRPERPSPLVDVLGAAASPRSPNRGSWRAEPPAAAAPARHAPARRPARGRSCCTRWARSRCGRAWCRSTSPATSTASARPAPDRRPALRRHRGALGDGRPDDPPGPRAVRARPVLRHERRRTAGRAVVRGDGRGRRVRRRRLRVRRAAARSGRRSTTPTSRSAPDGTADRRAGARRARRAAGAGPRAASAPPRWRRSGGSRGPLRRRGPSPTRRCCAAPGWAVAETAAGAAEPGRGDDLGRGARTRSPRPRSARRRAGAGAGGG